MTRLRLDNITGGPGQASVLQSITTRFGSGLTGLVGPNGAGKSTLLKICMGLLKPTHGSVLINDQPLQSLTLVERAKRLAYLPQNGPVHWAMRVRDLVWLGRYNSGVDKGTDEVAVNQAMIDCAVDPFAERMVLSLSGGERSRVLLARALAAQTPVLLVDEPTNALDPAQQHRVMNILRQKADEGTSIICAIHDLPLAAKYCDRLILLRSGKIIEDAKTAAVITSQNFTDTYGLAFDKRGYLRDEQA